MNKFKAIWHLLFAEHWYVVISEKKPRISKDGGNIQVNGLSLHSEAEEIL